MLTPAMSYSPMLINQSSRGKSWGSPAQKTGHIYGPKMISREAGLNTYINSEITVSNVKWVPLKVHVLQTPIHPMKQFLHHEGSGQQGKATVSFTGSKQPWGLAGLLQGAVSASTVCGLTNDIYIFAHLGESQFWNPTHVHRVGS